MERLSSNATLFFNLFLPVFWSVFFGAFTLGIFLADEIYVRFLPIASFRWAMLFFYFTGISVLYFTFLRIKRVELDSDYLYITNYFKTARYPIASLEQLEWRRWFLFSIGIIHLKVKGIFGQRIIYLSRKNIREDLQARFPHLVTPD
jgi:hypothetical protein